MVFTLCATDHNRLTIEQIKKFGFVTNANGKAVGQYNDKYVPVTVNLETLEDLINLNKEDGPIILGEDMEIELYNGYRE